MGRKAEGHDDADYLDFVANTASQLALEFEDDELTFLGDTLGHILCFNDDNEESLDDLIEDATNKISFDNAPEHIQKKSLLEAQQRLVGMVQYAVIDQTSEYGGLRTLLCKAGREVTVDRIRDYHLVLMAHFGVTELAGMFRHAMQDIGHAVSREEYDGALARRDHVQKYILTLLGEELGLLMLDTESFCKTLEQVKQQVIEGTLLMAERANDPEARKRFADRALRHADFDILKDYAEDIKRMDYAWVQEKVLDIFKISTA